MHPLFSHIFLLLGPGLLHHKLKSTRGPVAIRGFLQWSVTCSRASNPSDWLKNRSVKCAEEMGYGEMSRSAHQQNIHFFVICLTVDGIF